MPTSSPRQNPYLCVCLPLALQSPSGDAKESLLMAILAVAAFNKAELATSNAKGYRDQAVHFAERASSILKSYSGDFGRKRAGPEDEVDRKALLAAVVTMTTIEIFSGGQHGKGYESLLLGKQIINITGGPEWWVAEPMRLTLLQIYRCLEIVAHTSGWKPPSSSIDVAADCWSLSATSRPGDALQHPDDIAPRSPTSASRIPGPGGQYTLDVSFGVARKTLQCLNKTIELSSLREARQEQIPDWQWPDHMHSVLRQLESEIFDVFDDPNALAGEGASNLLAQEGISDYVNEEIKENHVWAFHYSVALFFRRALCDGGSSVDAMLGDHAEADTTVSTTGRWSGQELVTKALDHLENIDVLSGDAIVANTLWPAFVAAVEAVHTPLRHRALIWFVRAKRHGIGNIAKAKELAMEVWRRVDRQTWGRPEKKAQYVELSRVDWRKVMQEMKMYIMLT
ncbi:uncharacterized protein HMPREF1541_05753 [Cyphellophora europaea CBS 101466]|uniref:Uncharacterized protein n=1 Tax=Cyphellophora europaea (strain CBS 101466) TaxID=1220924 RepID=W2RSV0_CYPE1|nr:uncharacterized protein HMPREF1541_05753 [Cyphellophora europaea CBS 101466]ETN39527.1 hypothetical protein HMPREF1541_05753 [Cyphellophora europaea CBS 101466]